MLNRTLGHYRIVDKLGEGGMGVVYKAIDLTLGRNVALKVVHERLTQSAEARARLMREAQVAAALNHPNICTIYEVFEAEPQPAGDAVASFAGGPVIALELVDGDTLKAALSRAGRFSARELVDFGAQIADGLAEAHQRRIVHRDLKPQNILVTTSGRVKILDFGLAKAVADAGPTHDATTQLDAITDKWQAGAGVLGTAPYMSPEQAAGKPLDSRSDVFSFGTVLYELAAGQRPFRGETTVQVVAKILEAEPPPLSADRPDLPPDIERIIRRCLQKNPDDRYNDTRDLLADLRATQDGLRLASGRSAALAPVPASEPQQTRRVSRTAVAKWGGAAVALLVLVGVLYFRFGGSRQSATPPPDVAHRQLTFTGESSFPAISPDGAFVAYVRGEPWGEVFGTLVPLAPQKVVIQDLAGGGGELEVAECKPCSGLTWSPDGTSLLVADGQGLRIFPRLGAAWVRGRPTAKRSRSAPPARGCSKC
jgi:serine/threonine protein kinase